MFLRVIFLDVDGVLNNDETNDRTPGGFVGVSDVLLDRLSTIVEKSLAKIVLTSTWKEYWNHDDALCDSDGLYLSNRLNQFGLTIMDKIEDVNGSYYRGRGIKKYLDDHKNIVGYVILDDLEFDFSSHKDLLEHLVSTNGSEGLTENDIATAIQILRKDV